MAIREILTVPDPRLKEVSKPVVGPVTDEHRALMDDMLETMYDAPGIGLAAIQIGVPLRIIVMDLAREGEEKAPRYFVNPEIVETVEETKPYEEGCLSVPDIFDEVERPARCRIKYLDYKATRSMSGRTTSTPFAFSTRWTISKARSSSITCPA
jgi:peptide deformylase